MRFRFGKCFSSLMYFKPLNGFYSLKFSLSNRKTPLTNEIRLIYYTFFHNEHNDLLTIVETCLNPFIECASSLMRIIGWNRQKFLVGFVLILVFNMINLFYMVILPQILMTTWINFVTHFLIGNWLVINTVFHYLMGLITSPGFPPTTNVKNIVTICKKCILPKPARTHHCSICKRCVLKMDHHCPWFNNCIGFYNHRYFLMFCIFMTLDCSYLSTFGFYYYQSYVYPSMDLNILKLILNTGSLTVSLSNSYYYQLSSVEFFLAFIAGFAVCGLALVNIYIVSHGATNVELKSMKIPCVPSTYSNAKNPYDLGFVTNWKIFLGFDDFKSFVLKVILPSTHKPIGDGIDWTEYFNYQQNNSFSRYTILDV